MSIENVLKYLNKLVTDGIIGDYAIGGGYDLDVLVVLSSDEDYSKLYRYFTEAGLKIENVYIFIDDMPVQFLPNYISPLFNDAIENSIIVEYDEVQTNFVSPEHLVLLFLTAFRDKDKIRVRYLLEHDIADREVTLSLIERFDNGKDKLFEKYNKILG